MTLQGFSDWLAATALSERIQNITWIIPAVQTIHILSISVVMSSVLVIYLRILGVLGQSQTIAQVMARFLPWVWCTLVILLITGVTLIIGEPGRSLQNPAFLLKMSMLLIVIITTVLLQRPVEKDATYWERDNSRRAVGRLVAGVSLLMWIAIVCAGRMIAYVTTEPG